MNKFTTIFLSLFFFASSICFGQLTAGFFTGLNFAKLSGDIPESAEYQNKIGINIGAIFDINFSNTTILSIQPSYSQEGTRFFYSKPNLDEPIDSFSLGLDYFSVPVIFKILTTKKRFYGIAGIETGYFLGSSLIIKDVESELNVAIAQWNIALHFGVGIRMPVGKPRLCLELRYTQGLLNLTDQAISNSLIPRVKTSGVKLLLGIEFPLTSSNN